MSKIVTIAVRELIETIKTKTFFFSSVIVPALMLALIFGTQWVSEIAKQEEIPTREIDVVDEAGGVFGRFAQLVADYNQKNPQQKFEAHEVAPDTPVEQLRQRVRDNQCYAYLIIPAAVLDVKQPTGASQPAADSQPATDSQPVVDSPPAAVSQPSAGTQPAETFAASCELGRKDANIDTQQAIEGWVTQAVTALRIEREMRRQFLATVVNQILAAAALRHETGYELLATVASQAGAARRFEHATWAAELKRIEGVQAPVAFLQVDVTSGKRTMGFDLARFMTPFAFMFLLFMGTMTISQGLLTSLLEEKSSRIVEVLLSAVSPTQLMAGKILGMVGVGAVLLLIWGGAGYGAARARDVAYLVTPQQLTYLVLYFIPGFLLTSAFLAGVGAACNTIKEAQSMAAPLTLLTIVPMMLWWAITQNPSSMLSIVLSYIPPITPFVMILRICADPETPLAEVITTLLLLWLSVGVAIWLAGKIFRIGVLMYGKPPSLKELVRWLRYD